MGCSNGHTSLEGAAITANSKSCEVFAVMEPEAIARTGLNYFLSELVVQFLSV